MMEEAAEGSSWYNGEAWKANDGPLYLGRVLDLHADAGERPAQHDRSSNPSRRLTSIVQLLRYNPGRREGPYHQIRGPRRDHSAR